MTRHDEIACLDVLAAQLHARGWAAYITMPAGRLAALSVQDPHDRAQWSDVIAAPGGATGDWWYWFSWAERIGPIHAPAAAAEVIIRALQRPMDGAVLAGCEAAHGEGTVADVSMLDPDGLAGRGRGSGMAAAACLDGGLGVDRQDPVARP